MYKNGKIPDSQVTDFKIPDSVVTNSKILDSVVTNGKIPDSAVTTFKAGNQAVIIPVSAFTTMRNMIKEYVKQADDRFETLAYLNALLFSIVCEIREEKKEEYKNGGQSQAR